jgi:hypothetical protein
VWEWLDEAETCSQALQQPCATAAAARGLRRTPIVQWLAMMVPQRGVPSRATVGRGVAPARRRAGGSLAGVDRVGQAGVVTLGLEAMCWHQEPVGVAVEPHSMAWVAGPRGPERPGDRWCPWLQQWPGGVRVVRAAGPGLARGGTRWHAARAAAPETGQAPVEPVQVGVEVWHTERERPRGVRRRWAQAAKRWDTAVQADQQVAHATQRGSEARGATGRARAAWGKAERALAEAVQVDTAVEGLRAALAGVRPDGQRKDRVWAQAPITEARGALGGEAWGTVRRLLHEARTLTPLDWRHAPLAQAVSDPL